MTSGRTNSYRSIPTKFNFYDLLAYLSIGIFFIESTRQALQYRHAHGDGSLRFIESLSKNYSRNAIQWESNYNLSRDLIRNFKRFLAFYSVEMLEFPSISFLFFSCISVVILTLLLIAMFLKLKSVFSNFVSVAILLTILATTINALAFPDAEIIWASPIIILWVLYASKFLRGECSNKFWSLSLFVLFNVLFLSELHEIALPIIGSVVFFSMVQQANHKKLPSITWAILFLSFLIAFAQITWTTIRYTSSLYTAQSGMQETIFWNLNLIVYKPLVALIYVAFVLACLSYAFLKSSSRFAPQLHLVLLLFLIFYLPILWKVFMIEKRRVNNPWSFMQSRQDLAWFTLFICVLILIIQYGHIKLDALSKTETALEEGKLISFSSGNINFSIDPLGKRFAIFPLLLTLLASFSLRYSESNYWYECKARTIQSTSTYSGVVSRDVWPIADCDWHWADAGTTYLMFPSESNVRLPSPRLETNPDWPPLPTFKDGHVSSIFGYPVPPAR